MYDTETEDMISHCEDNVDELNSWEKEFIESIREQFDDSGRLSDKQLDILDTIYSKL